MNSGGSGRTCLWPGATMLAPRKAWKYSVPPSARRRVEHCVAFDLARAEVLAPVERDQHPPVKTLERRQRPRCLDRLHEQSVERRRRSAVQHQADVVVGGDRRHAEQRLAVRPAVPLRQRLLMPKERRASHEEDRKRRQTDVRHCVVAVAPRAFALVGQTGADLAQRPDHVCNGAHPALESTIEPTAQEKTTACCGSQSINPQHVAYRNRQVIELATQSATHSH